MIVQSQQADTETEVIEPAIDGVEANENPEGTPVVDVEAKEKAKRRLSDRNRELTFRLRQAERDLEAERKEKEELKSKFTIKHEPDPDDYSDRDKYTEDREAWKAQERARIRAEETQNISQAQARREHDEKLEKQKEAYLSSRAEAIKDDPKFHEYEIEIDKVVETFDAPEIQDLILAAKKNGPKIVKYLGTNPEALEEIADASPKERAFLMGKLVAKLEAKTVKTISTAPEPTRSERGSAQRVSIPTGKTYDPSKETFKAYSARINGLR